MVLLQVWGPQEDGPRGWRPGHQALAYNLPLQACLRGGGPSVRDMGKVTWSLFFLFLGVFELQFVWPLA